ncbi:MAG: response regulator, partial [Deltaproteobacteria bacterium]|nr:response regulator [Deltaproteobacteria bacterium]
MTQTHKLTNVFDKKALQLDLDPLASKILIVDDDPLNVDVLEEILKENDYADIKTTTDPFEAVELYKENDYDLILLDILMPGMDGVE